MRTLDYFTRKDGSDELACRCGNTDCDLTVRASSRYKANKLRELYGKPLYLFGARCDRHPEYSGPRSSHGDRSGQDGVKPCAFDVDTEKHSKDDTKAIIFIAQIVGFNRYGLSNTGQCHFDDDETKKDTYWVYS